MTSLKVEERYLKTFIPILLGRNGIAEHADTWRVLAVIMMSREYRVPCFDRVREFLSAVAETVDEDLQSTLDNPEFNASVITVAQQPECLQLVYNPGLFLDTIAEYVDQTTEDYLLEGWLYVLKFGEHSARKGMHSLVSIYNESLNSFFYAMPWDTDVLRVSCFLRYFYQRYGRSCCSMEEKSNDDVGEDYACGNKSITESVEEMKLCALEYVTDLSMKLLPDKFKTYGWPTTVYAWLYDRCGVSRYFENCTREFSAALTRLSGYFDFSGYTFEPKIVDCRNTQICPKFTPCYCPVKSNLQRDFSKEPMKVGPTVLIGSWRMTLADLEVLKIAQEKMLEVMTTNCEERTMLEEIRVDYLKDARVPIMERDSPKSNGNAEPFFTRVKSGRILETDLPGVHEAWQWSARSQAERKSQIPHVQERIKAEVMASLAERLEKREKQKREGDWKEYAEGIGRAPGVDSDDEDLFGVDFEENHHCEKSEPHNEIVGNAEFFFLVKEEPKVVYTTYNTDPIVLGAPLIDDREVLNQIAKTKALLEETYDEESAFKRRYFCDTPCKTDEAVPCLLRLEKDADHEALINVFSYGVNFGDVRVRTPILVGEFQKDQWRYKAVSVDNWKAKLPIHRKRLEFNGGGISGELWYKVKAVSRQYGDYWIVAWYIEPT